MFLKSCLNKLAIALLSFLFIIIPFKISGAANISWTGQGGDKLASNPGNWSQGIPGANDYVFFLPIITVPVIPGIADCIWDIPWEVKSFFMEPQYPGTITLAEDLKVGTGGISIRSGILNPGAKKILLKGDWIYFGGLNTPLGDIDGSGVIDTLDVNAIFSMVMDPSTTTYCSDMNIDNRTDILDVVLSLRVANGEDGTPRECSGGLFNPGTGTVRLTGTNQTISGDTVFYNLEKTANCQGGGVDTLQFELNSLQTILGKLTLTGDAGCTLALRSTQDGNPWNIDPQGTRNISYTSIRNMNNLNFVDIVTINSQDDGGNSLSVKFGGDQCVCVDEKLILSSLFSSGRRLPW